MPLHPLLTKRKDNTEFILGGKKIKFKFRGGRLKFYSFWCGYEWACVYYIVEVERKFQSNSIMSVFGHLSKYYITVCVKQSAP